MAGVDAEGLQRWGGLRELLRATEGAHPGCQIGSYPFFRDGRGGANFVIRSTEEARLEACRSDLLGQLESAGLEVAPEGL